MKHLISTSKTVKLIKNMESLKNCHSQVGPKETQCLNVMWGLGAASG